MTETDGGSDQRDRIDPAALMAAAVAAVLTITLSEGEWWWLDMIIGATLLLVLFAFYRPTAPNSRGRAWLKAAAFGAVAGLSVVLLVSYPVQEGLRQWTEPWCDELRGGQQPAVQVSEMQAYIERQRYQQLVGDCVATQASRILFPWLWLLAAFGLGAWHSCKARATGGMAGKNGPPHGKALA
jgi:hypothetical protein